MSLNFNATPVQTHALELYRQLERLRVVDAHEEFMNGFYKGRDAMSMLPEGTDVLAALGEVRQSCREGVVDDSSFCIGAIHGAISIRYERGEARI